MTVPVDAWGIQVGYHDADGRWHETPPDTVAAFRAAMGAETNEDAPPDPWTVWVVGAGESPTLIGPVDLTLEDGTELRAEGFLPPDLPVGYHTLHQLWDGGRRGDTTRLVVSPRRCAPPPPRTWGLSAQLYAARSCGSWGIGDLADLRALGAWLTSQGGGALLVNPLDAPTPVTPRDPSPYFPSTRRFRDPVYLRVEEVPGADLVDLSDLRAEGLAANDDLRLDREAAYRRVMTACERIFAAKRDAGEETEFRRFRRSLEPGLTVFATFCALAEEHGTGWRQWPSELRSPSTPAVRRFVADRSRRVTLHAWVQWLLDQQLAAAGAAAPLLRDLPVGFDPDGADAWEWQDLLADGVTVGAPPDPLGPQGQDWLLPAFTPWRLRQAAYQPIVDTLRSAFRHAAGLRIDHVLGLFRLFWIPAGGTPADGAYVRYPASELLDVLAVESHRAGAWVVGEDLGTVADGVREEMAARDILRYQVLWFEDAPPAQWSELAVASVTTHDLPTVAGWWTGQDADEQRRLGLEPDEAGREHLLDRLRRQTGLAADARAMEAIQAVHRLLGTAAARVVLAQLEDAVGVVDRVNVPGTTPSERPANWSRALPRPLEEVLASREVRAVLDALRSGR